MLIGAYLIHGRYAVGALSMGLLAQWAQGLDVTFWLVGVAMLLSGAWVALAFTNE